MVTRTAAKAGQENDQTVAAEGGAGRWRDAILVTGLRVGVILLALVLWQVMSGPVLPEYAVGKPTEVFDALVTMLGSSAGWTDIKVTAIEVAAGFGIGVVLGTVLGLLLASFPLAGRVFEPLIAAVNGIPKIALAPLFLLFFGIGAWSKIAIAVMGVAFVVFYNVYLGVRLRERELVEIVQVMGGRRHHVLSYVTIPTLAAPFFAGVKTGGPLAILGVIGAEFIASTNGIGHQLFTAATNLNAPDEFAGLIVLITMTLALNGLLGWLDELALRRLGLSTRRRPAAETA
ncbi:ABC transporter permease subunit [Actinomadura darangshiensis]|uniref:ABC transporter permease subunit n=1 Tax=Actinomadura darangshiensis TaxID=705336 RepID=A0A4R5BCZ9_9ACTN|nr:ABC transporter permease subunit [Actinomadura darangshiensis]TDD84388.1 ABC transporter permease subunit [Actinomadura darangshiensis]